MVLGAVACPVDKTYEVNRRLREIRTKHSLPAALEMKWNKISPAQLDFYLDIIDYFFDDDDLEFRTVVAPKSYLDHSRFKQTHDEWYYKMMFLLLRNILPAQGKAFIYLDKKDTRSGAKVKKLHEVIANSEFDFNRQKIKRLQIVESHHVGLLQLSDLLLGSVNYANRNLTTSEAKLRIVNRIRERTGLSLTRTTLLKETKFNILVWRPQEITSNASCS